MWMIEGVGDTAGVMEAVFLNVDTAIVYADAAGVARERLYALTLPRALAAVEAAGDVAERAALEREREGERARAAEADRGASETRGLLNASDELLDETRRRLVETQKEVVSLTAALVAAERELKEMRQRVAFAVSTLNAALHGQSSTYADLDHA